MSHLYEDRAATLGRIGGTLESLIDTLNTIRMQLAAMPERDRSAALGRYASLLERARTWRWYLEVQREAVGLTRHDLIDQLYPLPPAEPL
ncbi:MAG TPA: hypothetical protein VL262_14215 [Vicinamibacterales bacterium]|jgi:hypothetical protein|nr:hypothetical protein [Vicinamibacterales bacterium]